MRKISQKIIKLYLVKFVEALNDFYWLYITNLRTPEGLALDVTIFVLKICLLLFGIGIIKRTVTKLQQLQLPVGTITKCITTADLEIIKNFIRLVEVTFFQNRPYLVVPIRK